MKAEITGQVLLDMLEMSMRSYPEEDGAFPHMSGMTFSVDKSIPSSVKVDENGFFTEVKGDYRVYDVKVFDKESGIYKDLELDGKYVLVSTDYYILDFGSGMAVFEGANIIENEGMLDVEVLERYITDNLNGIIGEEYKNLNSRITFTDGKANKSLDTFDDLTKDSEYADAAEFVIENGFMSGVSESRFAPDIAATRAMTVTALWRMEGCPALNYALSYEDAFSVSEYAIPAFQWTCGSGIMSGNTISTLAPAEPVSRIYFASVLHRY